MLKPLLIAASLLVASSSSAEVTELDSAELQTLIEQGAVVVDVRREDEWKNTGIIKNSHLLTFFDARGNYDAQAWLQELDKLAEKDETVILICARGVRSSNIAKLLDKRLGYSRIHNVTRGINDWIAGGHMVVDYSTKP